MIVAYKETEGHTQTGVYTKDNKLVKLSSRYSYQYIVQVGSTAKDSENQSFIFNISYHNLTSRDSLINKIVSYKKENKNKASWQRNFFVIIPEKNETIRTHLGNFVTMLSNEDNTSFCVLSKTKESIGVFDKNNSVIRVIKIDP